MLCHAVPAALLAVRFSDLSLASRNPLVVTPLYRQLCKSLAALVRRLLMPEGHRGC